MSAPGYDYRQAVISVLTITKASLQDLDCSLSVRTVHGVPVPTEYYVGISSWVYQTSPHVSFSTHPMPLLVRDLAMPMHIYNHTGLLHLSSTSVPSSHLSLSRQHLGCCHVFRSEPFGSASADRRPHPFPRTDMLLMLFLASNSLCRPSHGKAVTIKIRSNHRQEKSVKNKSRFV